MKGERFAVKKKAVRILSVLIVCIAAAVMLAACGSTDGTASDNAVSMEEAEALMISYLKGKGFADDDFLAEGTVMELDGVRVYAFSWRTKVNENADRLFGTYAVSTDGKSFYEYQSTRETWIRDSAASYSE